MQLAHFECGCAIHILPYPHVQPCELHEHHHRRNNRLRRLIVAVTLKHNEQVTERACAYNGDGSANETATVSWTGDNDAVATVVPGADGRSATVVARGPGTMTVHATATEGADTVTSEPVAITVEAATLASVSVSDGTPEPQPAPPVTV